MRSEGIMIRNAFFATLALGLGSLVASGCSLIIHVDECSQTSDCTGGLVCRDHLCVSTASSDGGVDGGTPDSGTPDGGCSTHTACASALGEGWVCGKAGTCIAARTPSCANVVGPIDRDNTVILGSIMPTSMGWESLGRPIEQGMELAIQEINQTGGITGGRQIAIVQCDDEGNAQKGRDVAQHLIDLGVPAIIGPAFSGIFIDVTTQVTAPAGVMTMSPSATSPLIANIDDHGLGWRTAANDTFQAVALADLIRGRGYAKLIALGKDDAYGSGLLGGVTTELAASFGEDLYSHSYPDPGNTTNPDFPGAVATALGSIATPNAVTLLGTTETVQIMHLFETAITTSTQTRYLFADGGKLQEMLDEVKAHPGLLDRVEGTEADHQSGSLYRNFALRYSQKFGADPGIYAVNAYDATYLLAYGLCSIAADHRATGTDLAGSMAKLVSGRKIDAGPLAFGDGRSTLTAGGSIDYNGASGPLDFDLTTGEAPANVALWQVEQHGAMDYRFKTAGHYTIGSNGRGTWQLDP